MGYANQHLPMIRAARAQGWAFGAEIGVANGKMLFAMLDALPDLSMIGVGLWQRTDPSDKTDMDAAYAQAWRQSAQYGARCKLIRADSVAVAPEIADESLDFVFINAGPEGVERDIRAWAQKVKPTGMVFGHDIKSESVRVVINRLVPSWVGYGDGVWAAERRDVLA